MENALVKNQVLDNSFVAPLRFRTVRLRIVLAVVGAVMGVSVLAAPESVVSPGGVTFGGNGKVWTIYPEVTDGMTGPQQLTNAFMRATYCDLIVVKPGTYDFTGIAMRVDNYSAGGVSYSITNHLSVLSADRGGAGNLWFALYGDDEDKWGSQVVFKGNGRFLDMYEWTVSMIQNVTFDGFDAGSYPSDGSHESRGGAVHMMDNCGLNHTLSNCVIRNCRAWTGGAVNGGNLMACCVSNCQAISCGAVGCNTALADSLLVDNSAAECGALFCGEWCTGNTFLRNRAEGRCGAVRLNYGCSKAIADNVFIGNTSGTDAGALYFTANVLTNCTFVGNVASNGAGGAVYAKPEAGYAIGIRNCSFVSNMAYSVAQNKAHSGGAVCGAVYGGLTLPIVDCGFTNNYAWGYGGAVYYGACTNCSFVGNRAVYFGAALAGVYSSDNMENEPYYAEAYNCVFRDNLRQDPTGRKTGEQTQYGGTDGFGAKIVRCDSNIGGYWRCHVESTRIHHVTNLSSCCVFYEQNFVTNCLIDNCNLTFAEYGLCYRYLYGPEDPSIWCRGRDRGTFVNCTFADNLLHDSRGFCSAEECDHPLDFKNCILWNNKKANGTVADISGRNVAGGVTYENCLYGASDGSLVDGDGNPAWWDLGNNIVGADPRFAAGKAERLGVDYYALRTSSPARGRGDESVFSETDLDLAGNLRLRDGKCDLGCYECWLDPIGAMLLLR